MILHDNFLEKMELTFQRAPRMPVAAISLKATVINGRNNGISCADLARSNNINRRTVKKWIYRVQKCRPLYGREGRPAALDIESIQHIHFRLSVGSLSRDELENEILSEMNNTFMRRYSLFGVYDPSYYRQPCRRSIKKYILFFMPFELHYTKLASSLQSANIAPVGAINGGLAGSNSVIDAEHKGSPGTIVDSRAGSDGTITVPKTCILM